MPLPRWFRRAERDSRDDTRDAEPGWTVPCEITLAGTAAALKIRTSIPLDENRWPDYGVVLNLVQKRYRVPHIWMEPVRDFTVTNRAWWLLDPDENLVGTLRVLVPDTAPAPADYHPRMARRRRTRDDRPVVPPAADLEIWSQQRDGLFVCRLYPGQVLTQEQVESRVHAVLRFPFGRQLVRK